MSDSISEQSSGGLAGRKPPTPLSLDGTSAKSTPRKEIGFTPGLRQPSKATASASSSAEAWSKVQANGKSGINQENFSQKLAMDPDMAMKIMAYKERQERRGKKKLGMAAEEAYLSQVPEVERDIPFHFMFEVNGELHEIAVKNACESDNAQALRQSPETNSQSSRSSEKAEKVPSKTYRSGSATFLPYVSLCEIPRVETASLQMARRPSNSKVRLAKMSFRILPHGKLTKACNSASDAENCCMIFMVTIDDTVDKGAAILQRLEEIEKMMLQMTESIPATRRPVPAIFLLHKPRADVKSWQKVFEEYEATKGTTLRYGPMSMEDGNAIYEAFANLATSRIHAQEKGFTSRQLWSSDVRKLAWPMVNMPADSMSALNRSKSLASSVSSVSRGMLL